MFGLEILCEKHLERFICTRYLWISKKVFAKTDRNVCGGGYKTGKSSEKLLQGKACSRVGREEKYFSVKFSLRLGCFM